MSRLLYRNPLRSPADLADWIGEGPVAMTETPTGVELSSSGGDDDGHWTLWCPEEFGDGIRISWDFTPVAEPGLAMIFFGATTVDGASIFDADAAPRTGAYPEYHSGDLRALHVSYFRRRWPDERALHTCNLRKAPGFHLVAQGADPLPSVGDVAEPYRVEVHKDGSHVEFAVDGLTLFAATVPADTGPEVGGGRIGFRQMAPLTARYSNLEVRTL